MKKKIDCKPNTCRERQAPPSKFHKKSFRMKKVPGKKGTYLVIACPKTSRFVRGRCSGPTRVQSIVRPTTSPKCNVCHR